MTAMLNCIALARPWPGLLLALSLAACSASDTGVADEELGGLVLASGADNQPVRLGRVGYDVAELGRVAHTSHERVGQLLGAHRYRSTSSIVVREGDAIVESLETDTFIELADSGDFRARNENSRDYGREVFFTGGFLYLAPRYSRFHRRAPERMAEPAQIRNQIYGDLGAHLELLTRGIEIEEQASGTRGETGDPRQVRNITVKKSERTRPPARPTELRHRAWRDSIDVVEASGELALDEETGVVLHALVHGAVTFERDGRSFVMTFDVEHDIADIGAEIAIAAPPDDAWVATPVRRREVDERDRLLQGIAPPTRKVEPRKRSTTSASKPGKGSK